MESFDSNVNISLHMKTKIMETNGSIGSRLRDERERLDISQTDFAAIAGATRQTQSKYEKGERFPDALYLSKILDLGCDVAYILAGTRSGDPRPLALNPKGSNALNMKLMSIAIRELEAALKRHRKTLDPERKARAVSVLYEYLEKLEQANSSGKLDESAVDRYMEALF